MQRSSRACWVVLCLACLSLSAACSGPSPSTLDPQGPKSETVAGSWWLLLGVAAAVCLIVTVLAVVPVLRRRRVAGPRSGDGMRVVLVCGVILPAIVFASTFGLSMRDLVDTSRAPTTPRMTIDVIGHQWWWEVRYSGGPAVTANEIHVPVGTNIRLRLRTADVIHSFWVPQVMPKMDLLPRRVNQTWLRVDRVGRYRGQCAEYCGLQHAHMAFFVVAQHRAGFDTWLRRMSATARQPVDAMAQRGEQVFTSTTCATCHTVRGTSADGHVGPDLTHVGSRSTLASGLIPNDVGSMSGWIANSQAVKPGNKMPPQKLSPADLRAVVAYLQELR